MKTSKFECFLCHNLEFDKLQAAASFRRRTTLTLHVWFLSLETNFGTKFKHLPGHYSRLLLQFWNPLTKGFRLIYNLLYSVDIKKTRNFLGVSPLKIPVSLRSWSDTKYPRFQNGDSAKSGKPCSSNLGPVESPPLNFIFFIHPL